MKSPPFRRNETHLKVSNSFSLQYSKMILLLVSVNLSVLDFKLESLGMRLTRLEEWLASGMVDYYYGEVKTTQGVFTRSEPSRTPSLRSLQIGTLHLRMWQISDMRC